MLRDDVALDDGVANPLAEGELDVVVASDAVVAPDCVDESDKRADDEREALLVAKVLADGDELALAVLVAVVVGTLERLALALFVAVADTESDVEGVVSALEKLLEDGLPVAVVDRFVEAVGADERDCVPSTVAGAVDRALIVADTELTPGSVAAAVALAHALAADDVEAEPLLAALAESAEEPLPEGDKAPLADCVPLAIALALAEADSDGDAVTETVPLADGVARGVRDGCALALEQTDVWLELDAAAEAVGVDKLETEDSIDTVDTPEGVATPLTVALSDDVV